MYKHLINTPAEALAFLDSANKALAIKTYTLFNQQVLTDERWLRVPATISHHVCAAHKADGGLLVHTAQVAMTMATMLKSVTEGDDEWTNARALTAAIWHDYAKIHEYRFKPDESTANAGEWTKTAYYKEIGHVAGSYLAFTEAAQRWNAVRNDDPIKGQSIEIIQHAILAHHGRMEWGSPKEPQNALAWALHAADMMSAHFSF